MRINHEKYLDFVSFLDNTYTDKELYAPILLNHQTFIFPFVDIKNYYLVLSLNHQMPAIYDVGTNNFFTSLETPFYLRFKKLIGRSIIRGFALADNDLILTIALSTFDELENEKNISLICELIPTKPNLILVDEKNVILDSYFKDKNRDLSKGNIYKFPIQNGEPTGDLIVGLKFIGSHFQNECKIRHKEKYNNFIQFIKGKMKAVARRDAALNSDLNKAEENLKCRYIAVEILSLGLNLKSHLSEVETSQGIIQLDKSKTVYENVEILFKKAKKASVTINQFELNKQQCLDELKYYKQIVEAFSKCDEFAADKLLDEIGFKNKKKEVKETPFNIPYKVNYNGTIIYFGRNANQNDYLSFVMKLNRDFTWMHIKDKSGTHIVIANVNPTENEIKVAAEIALICSRAIAGEVVFTKKKNVRRGHVLGEAVLKNYITYKINSVSNETKELFLTAKRVK